MSQDGGKGAAAKPAADAKPKKKICCSCPETKVRRERRRAWGDGTGVRRALLVAINSSASPSKPNQTPWLLPKWQRLRDECLPLHGAYVLNTSMRGSSAGAALRPLDAFAPLSPRQHVRHPKTSTPKPNTGEDHPYCKALIEAHRQCLRLEGFDV